MEQVQLAMLLQWDVTERQLIRYNLLCAIEAKARKIILPFTRDDPRQFQLIPDTYVVTTGFITEPLLTQVITELKQLFNFGVDGSATVQVGIGDISLFGTAYLGRDDVCVSWDTDVAFVTSQSQFAELMQRCDGEPLITFPDGNQMKFSED